jgi:hypothetical protein
VAQKPESLSLSSLKYEDEMDLTAFIFADSVKMHDVFAPHFVSATLQAEWLQQSEGLLDIGPAVAAHFPQGIVSSLNDDFGDVSHHVKKSGYQIVETSFQGINPPHTGPLNIYPQNATIVGKNNPMTLPRHWFRLSWKMGWTYEQKRIETVTLSWPFCPFGYPVPPLFEFSKDAPQGLRVCVPSEETLIDSETSMLLWKVQDVEKTKGFRPHLATLKELWPQLIKKALPSLKQAFVERFQTPAWVTVSWEKGCLLSPGQKISWQHQQQLFHGIISKIEIHAENSKREALLHVRLTPPWLQAWQNSQETLSAVFALTSLQGFTQETLTEAESLVDVSIENDAESQTKQLSSCKFSTENEVRNWISQHPTRLRLDLKDLRTKKALHHHYAVLVDNAKQ